MIREGIALAALLGTPAEAETPQRPVQTQAEVHWDRRIVWIPWAGFRELPGESYCVVQRGRDGKPRRWSFWWTGCECRWEHLWLEVDMDGGAR